MPEGTCVGPQGTVPLQGESEIKQITAATDIITLTGAASQTGDYLICQTNTGTEKVVLTSAGGLSLAGTFGFNGATATGTTATLAALSVVSGAFGASSSAAYLLLVAMVQACHDKIKDMGGFA